MLSSVLKRRLTQLTPRVQAHTPRRAVLTALQPATPRGALSQPFSKQPLNTHRQLYSSQSLTQRYFSSSLVQIKLPDLGEGTKEATIKEWFVKEGDTIKEFDQLCEVFTDKLVAQIPATCSGVVKSIKYVQDDVCLVGHSLVEIETSEEGASGSSSSDQAEGEKKDESKVEETKVTQGGSTSHS